MPGAGVTALLKATLFRASRALSKATKTRTVARSQGAAFQSCDVKQEGTDFSHSCGLRHTFFLEKHLQNEYYITGGTWGRAGPGRGRADDTDFTQLTQRQAALPAHSAIHLLFRFSLYFSKLLHTHAQERQKEEEEEVIVDIEKKKHMHEGSARRRGEREERRNDSSWHCYANPAGSHMRPGAAKLLQHISSSGTRPSLGGFKQQQQQWGCTQLAANTLH